MQLSGNTILLTGGSSGIGLALTRRLIAAGNQVIVTGRRADALAAVTAELPSVITEVNDAADAGARARLIAGLTARFPDLNVLINNAGIQRRVDLVHGEPWEATREEIAINLEAPLHFASLLIPHLRERPRAALINVSSGLAFVPLAAVPMYSANETENAAAGIIGENFLRNFKVVLDYGRMRLDLLRANESMLPVRPAMVTAGGRR